MRKIIIVFYCLVFQFNAIAQPVLYEYEKVIAPNGILDGWFGQDVAISKNFAIIGAKKSIGNTNDRGLAYVFEFIDGSWFYKQTLVASDAQGGDYFGFSVAISGNKAIIGSPFDINSNGSDAGAAYVFEFNGSNWVETNKLMASDGAANDNFGRSVAIDSNVIIIGSHWNDNINGIDAGAAYIFEYNSSWTETAKLMASDGIPDQRYAWSVAIHNNRAVVGAHYDDDNGIYSGSAYIYEKNSGWTETSKIVPSDNQADDYFGVAVSVYNNNVLIGANRDENFGFKAGSAYVFNFDGLNWNQSAKLIPTDGIDYLFFGGDVAISKNKIIIGSHQDDDNGSASGSAHIYEFNGTLWYEKTKVLASEGTNVDRFGWAVAISNDRAICGSYYDDNSNAADAGASYFYLLKGVYGNVFLDTNANCLYDSFEDSLPGRNIVIQPGNISTISNAKGNWYIDSLLAGNYTATVDITGNWLSPCLPANQSFTISNSDTLTAGPNFGLIYTGTAGLEYISNHPIQITILPNPTHSYFTIKASEINDSPFEIMDITGKIIITGVLKNKITTVDLSNKANGIYLLKVESETFKIIKQ